MTINRKNKVRYIQFVLILIALILFSFTYKEQIFKTNNNNISKQKLNPKNVDNIDENKNEFELVEYSGKSNNGYNFNLKADKADYDNQNTEIINLRMVTAKFFLKEGVLIITSNEGIYNNVTLDMSFNDNIIAKFRENLLTADNIDFFNSKNIMNIYGNVKAIGVEGNFETDKADLDLTNNSLILSMLSEKQVKMLLK